MRLSLILLLLVSIPSFGQTTGTDYPEANPKANAEARCRFALWAFSEEVISYRDAKGDIEEVKKQNVHTPPMGYDDEVLELVDRIYEGDQAGAESVGERFVTACVEVLTKTE